MAHLVLHPPWQEMRAKGGQRKRGRSAVTITQWLTSHPTTMSRPPCASVAWSHARVCESVRFWRFMLGSRGGRGGVTVSACLSRLALPWCRCRVARVVLGLVSISALSMSPRTYTRRPSQPEQSQAGFCHCMHTSLRKLANFFRCRFCRCLQCSTLCS